METAYGFESHVPFAHHHGVERRWYRTAEERDAGLDSFRAYAIKHGLAESSAHSGTHKVESEMTDAIAQSIVDREMDEL